MKIHIGPYRKNRKIDIRIDKYDTWSMDHTLALIILPMLKQLRDTTHGSAIVDLEDVPQKLQGTTHYDYEEQLSFDFYKQDEIDDLIHTRWNWVLDEMIWAFEQLVDEDNEAQFWSGEHDIVWEPHSFGEDGKPKYYEMKKGPNHTAIIDEESYRKHHERIENGLRLFGKYYRGLWD